jgi:hypothetical protein
MTALSSSISANTVRESVIFHAVGQYGAGNVNEVDVSATSDGGVNAISYGTFVARLEQAHASGLGGVVDFEQPFAGDSLVAVDKTLVNAYAFGEFVDGVSARLSVYDNPLIHEWDDPYQEGLNFAMDGSDEGLIYDLGDPGESITVFTLHAEPGAPLGFANTILIDPDRVIIVENRVDRPFLTTEPGGIVEMNNDSPLFAQIGIRYGLEGEKQFMIGRGSMHIEEAGLASQFSPGPRAFASSEPWVSGRGPTNDEFYFRTDSGSSSLRPLSGSAYLGGGGGGDATAKDLLFDPRSNIVALGFTLLSYNNFQYWQGVGATPDNPDNIIVTAAFSDGTTTDYRGTTQQSSGGADTFFGIEAPLGASITRLQIRVVGVNFRTFTHVDDLAFITEPEAPYLLSGTEPSLRTPIAAIGRPFFRKLEFSEPPVGVDFSGLEPLGLSFDPETGVISGVPSVDLLGQATREISVPITIANNMGVREESLHFTFAEPQPFASPPVYWSPDAFAAVIGYPLDFVLRFDWPVELAHQLDVMVHAFRLDPDGERTIIALEEIGLSLSDGILTGTPLEQAVGDYQLRVQAMTPAGGSEQNVSLKIRRQAPEPDFDSDSRTDWLHFDKTEGVVRIALTSDLDEGDGSRPRIPADGNSFTPIIENIADGVTVHTADFNGDFTTDILTFDPVLSELTLYLLNGLEVSAYPPLAIAPEGQWELAAVDTNRFVLRNLQTNAFEFWTVSESGGDVSLNNVTSSDGDAVRWLSLSGAAEIVLWEDFDGDNQKEALLELGDAVYAFAEFAEEPKTPFVMADGLRPVSAFLNAAGSQIAWENENGLFLWEPIRSLALPEAHFIDGNSVPITADASSAGAFIDFQAIGGDRILASGQLDPGYESSYVIGDADGAVVALIHQSRQVRHYDLMQDGATPRPKVLRDAATGEIVTGTRTITLADRFLSSGEDLGLLPDEALNDLPTSTDAAIGAYQIFEQKRDDQGALMWDYSFSVHALPVADTTSPVQVEGDALFDGYIGPGQALVDYRIYLRTEVDGEGRPLSSRDSRFGRLPGRAKSDTFPRVLADSEDLAWTPMPTALDGGPFVDSVDGVANYDARGNRGFLQRRDFLGSPLFDAAGQPIYELWLNQSGLTVEEQALSAMIAGACESVGRDILGLAYPEPNFSDLQLSEYAGSALQWEQFLDALEQAVNAVFTPPVELSLIAGPDGFASLDFHERGESALSLVAEALSVASGTFISAADLSGFGYPQDVLLYELDHDSQPSGVFEAVSPSARLNHFEDIADLNGDGIWEIRTKDPIDGSYSILYADELQLSDWVLWQRVNFGSEFSGDAWAEVDPDRDGASNLYEYAFGVDAMDLRRPEPIALEVTGTGKAELSFPWRTSDSSLSVGVEQLHPDGSWSPLEFDLKHQQPINSRVDRVTIEVTPVPQPDMGTLMRLTMNRSAD